MSEASCRNANLSFSIRLNTCFKANCLGIPSDSITVFTCLQALMFSYCAIEQFAVIRLWFQRTSLPISGVSFNKTKESFTVFIRAISLICFLIVHYLPYLKEFFSIHGSQNEELPRILNEFLCNCQLKWLHFYLHAFSKYGHNIGCLNELVVDNLVYFYTLFFFFFAEKTD